MKINLWQPCSGSLGLKIEPSNAMVVPLWETFENINKRIEKKRQEEIRRQQNIIENRKKNLLQQKETFIKEQQSIKSFAQVLDMGIKYYKQGKIADAEKILFDLIRDPLFAPYKNEPEAAAAMFYLLREKLLPEKMKGFAENCLQNIAFDDDNLELFYDIAVFYEEYDDPSIAKDIYKKFIDNLYMDFKDVSGRYNRLLSI